jgi:hypothetical protein
LQLLNEQNHLTYKRENFCPYIELFYVALQPILPNSPDLTCDSKQTRLSQTEKPEIAGTLPGGHLTLPVHSHRLPHGQVQSGHERLLQPGENAPPNHRT